MTASELLKKTAEENKTREILEIMKGCTDLPEAIEKIQALLEQTKC